MKYKDLTIINKDVTKSGDYWGIIFWNQGLNSILDKPVEWSSVVEKSNILFLFLLSS